MESYLVLVILVLVLFGLGFVWGVTIIQLVNRVFYSPPKLRGILILITLLPVIVSLVTSEFFGGQKPDGIPIIGAVLFTAGALIPFILKKPRMW